MDRELIIQAFKSTCGNKNFRFQVLQNSKLHIHANHKKAFFLFKTKIVCPYN